ncbi:MAG: hypothetical protein Q9167_001577 [Letrouitia subvulpina]
MALPDFSVNISTMSESNDNGKVKAETSLGMEQSSSTEGSPKAKLEEFPVTSEMGQEPENSLGVEKASSGHGLGYSSLPVPSFSSPDVDYGRSPLTIQNLVQNDSVGQALPSNATPGSGPQRFARHQSLEQSPRNRPRSYTADPLGRGPEHISWQPQARGSNLRNVVDFEGLQNFDQNSPFSSTQLGVTPHPLTVNQHYTRGHILGSSHNNSGDNSGLPRSSRRSNPANLGNVQSYNYQPSSHDYGDHWQNQSFSSSVIPTHSFNDPDHSMRSLATPQVSSQYGGALQGYDNNHLAVTRTAARALPLQDNSNPYNLHYKTVKEAQEARRPRMKAIPHDNSVPFTNQSRQKCVRRMVNAMLNMEKAQDNPNMISTWAKMMEDGPRVEQAAWHVLDLALQIHQDGYPIPTTKPSGGKYDKFKTRWSQMCEGLLLEKTMCKHLCGTNFPEQFVNDPISATHRVQNNRKVNKNKSAVILQGRAVFGMLDNQKRSSSSPSRDNVSDIGDYNDEEDYWDKGGLMHKLEEKTDPKMLTGATSLQSTSLVRKPRSRQQLVRENESGSEYEVPAPKRQRESRSKYQINDHNVMVNILTEGRYHDSDNQRNMIIANSQGRVTRQKVYEMQNQNLRRRSVDSAQQQQAATHNEPGSDMATTEDEDAEGDVDLEYSGYGGDQSGLSTIPSTGRHGQL